MSALAKLIHILVLMTMAFSSLYFNKRIEFAIFFTGAVILSAMRADK